MVWTCNPVEIVTGGPLSSLASQVCPRSQWETVSQNQGEWLSLMTLRADLWPPHTCIRIPPHPRAPQTSIPTKRQRNLIIIKITEEEKGSVRKIWSFSCELKKTFLAKEVTEAREDLAAPGAFCPGFLPHPILEFMSELWIWTASSVAWCAWLKAELCRIIWHYVSERKQINAAFAKRQLQNFKGFHGYTGDPARAREAGRLGNEDRETERDKGGGGLERRRKGRRAEREEAGKKIITWGDRKLRKTFLTFKFAKKHMD